MERWSGVSQKRICGEQVRSKEEKKRRSDMKSRSEVWKEKRNWSWSGERKEKSRSGMTTKKGDL
jgi:hypothetical protein